MPAQLIVQLLVAFGPSAINLIDQLIAKWSTNAAITSADWATLRVSAMQTAKDRMTAQLTAAGIALDSPQAIAMLALAGN
jgi:hypothetical protein